MIVLLLANTFIILVCAGWLTYYVRRKVRFLAKAVVTQSQDVASRAWATRTIDGHIGKELVLPSPNPWTLDAAAISTLCRLLEQRKPRMVLELGSGLSTIIIASYIKQNGGRFVSVDHDPKFADVTLGYLRANGLSQAVDLKVCPLLRQSKTNNELWYNTSLVEGLNEIDFLVVDGPPKPFYENIRRHAISVVGDRLTPSACILLDDVDRPAEKETILQWQAKFPDLQCDILGHPKAHAILRLGTHCSA
jgi:predicted O-methyltransferase YrrM